MKDVFCFDSKSKKYKSPFGAVVCGESVTLSAYALRTEILGVELVAFYEYEQNEKQIEMLWESRECDYDRFTVSFVASEKPDIIWYYFRCTDTNKNTYFWGKNGAVQNKEEVLAYQMTAYSREYKTPEWFSEGVTYHIFVDRFNRASSSPELLCDDYFYVHADESETPLYKPNNCGVVENRDIYGGNIDGITEKLPYLQELGVKTIYLSPVFESWSNHKYNTADYKHIDSHFGDEASLKRLCSEAKKCGMRVILDGVFSHTGSDSIYFNREGRYGESSGAWRDSSSPFREWYDIAPDGKYPSWWGIDTLPQVDELNPAYRDYIIRDDESVVAKWMRAGVSGWRLDVADELPDVFIGELKERATSEKEDALLIGEVWEDASTKKAYGVSKKYFTEGILDGVMNYPLKNAVLDFLSHRSSVKDLKNALLTLCENYPPESLHCLMNIIGTHDTVRVINELSVGSMQNESKEFRAERKLSEEERLLGKTRLFQASVLQYMFPGSPCIYYGDEIGMEGFEDPFNRRFFTWDDVDYSLLAFYRKLGEIKRDNKSMHGLDFDILYAKGDVVSVSRGEVTAFVNRGKKPALFKLHEGSVCLLENGGCYIRGKKLYLAPCSCCVIKNQV